VVLCGVMLVATACHGLLDVTDPTVLKNSDLASASGANARRLNTVLMLSQNIGGAFQDVAAFSDERMWDTRIAPATLWGNMMLNMDRRDGDAMATLYAADNRDGHLDDLDQIFAASSPAVYAMRLYGADSIKHEYLAQLFAIRGYVLLQMAEDMCPGFPINDISSGNQPVYSQPYTTDSAFAYASAQLDSALVHGRDSARFVNFARVVQGRALLDLGQYGRADSVVTSVPTDFAYLTDEAVRAAQPLLWSQRYGCCAYVGDHDGGNGLPFRSAHDPRVGTVFKRFDLATGTDSLFDQVKYANGDTPLVLASGIEARLIQAEVALHNDDPSWLAILNTLRTTCTDASTCPSPPAGTGGVAGLAPLSDPGTPTARVDLVYRERAFWLYITGRRLGDMRRLVRNYGRAIESVFPSGTYHNPVGGTYGTATSIPFTLAAQARFNPHITTGCTAP